MATLVPAGCAEDDSGACERRDVEANRRSKIDDARFNFHLVTGLAETGVANEVGRILGNL